MPGSGSHRSGVKAPFVPRLPSWFPPAAWGRHCLLLLGTVCLEHWVSCVARAGIPPCLALGPLASLSALVSLPHPTPAPPGAPVETSLLHSWSPYLILSGAILCYNWREVVGMWGVSFRSWPGVFPVCLLWKGLEVWLGVEKGTHLCCVTGG